MKNVGLMIEDGDLNNKEESMDQNYSYGGQVGLELRVLWKLEKMVL